MRFGEAFLEELKARVRPSEVIGRHVKLRRQGREFAGLSPFTNEKTPSFFVNDQKGFYHCFSSGKHGDAISFLMEVEGLSFPESVEKLAGMAGMELPAADPKAEARAAEAKQAISWMERAQEYFRKSLMRDEGAAARAYLNGRGLGQQTGQVFGLGYAPNKFEGLRDHLMQQGASLDDLMATGLLVMPEESGRQPWDRFRDRIMFPIHDSRGRLVAFGGRAMAKDAKAKYLNSPETDVFHKGRLLYNYHRARRNVSGPESPMPNCIVAEGYMDVIALVRAGFTTAVAPLGTALTEDQLELLWRAGPEPILCFDGDKAGQRAAYRSVERALPRLKPERSLRFASLPEGQDPDDLIRAKGAGAMQAVLDRARPLVDLVWERELSAGRTDTPEARAGLKDRLFQAIREIGDESVRAQYQTELLSRFDAEYGRRKSAGRAFGSAPPRKLSSGSKAKMDEDHIRASNERRLIGAVVEWPDLLLHLDEDVLGMDFASGDASAAQAALSQFLRDGAPLDRAHIEAQFRAMGLDRVLDGLARARRDTRAAFGGDGLDLDARLTIWRNMVRSLNNDAAEDSDLRDRMAASIAGENPDRLHRLMRARLEDD